jgi:hypothetical protein
MLKWKLVFQPFALRGVTEEHAAVQLVTRVVCWSEAVPLVGAVALVDKSNQPTSGVGSLRPLCCESGTPPLCPALSRLS